MQSEKYNCHFLQIPEIGALIRAELSSGWVRVITGKVVQRISQDEDELRVHTDISETEAANMLLVAAGARPDADLAQTAGIGSGVGNAISIFSFPAGAIRDFLFVC